jgi:acyl-CoA synthetase (AMP-forming)/AMP-acid ligase II
MGGWVGGGGGGRVGVLGMTELSPSAISTPSDPRLVRSGAHTAAVPRAHRGLTAVRAGSVGLLLPCSTAKIVDAATGRLLGPGEEGELWIRGPNVMKGYLNNPDATAATIDADGYLHTGASPAHTPPPRES